MAREKLVIIGAGAAGFFCAVNAARLHADLDVVIIEKSSKVLSKVKVSGGGRCNVTHACFSIAEMIRNYPRGEAFLKKAFHQFFTTETISWFEERLVQLKTESDGRMFPITNNSQTIIDCLLKEAKKYNVEVLTNTTVQKIQKADQKFQVEMNGARKLVAKYLCVASGGYSKSSQFEWLKETGHTIAEPVPSLFTFNIPGDNIIDLMGVSVAKANIKIRGTKLHQSGPLLITHWGLSGPAILKSSAYGARILAEKNYDYGIQVNWLPDYNEQSLKEKFQSVRFDIAAKKMVNKNPFELPGRLWEYFLNACSIRSDLRWADLPVKEQNKLIKVLSAQEFEVKGKTTFKEEFVTAGGINLEEINAATMESKIIPHLYFAGEVMNIDGVTGGFNFQNAWTTGWIAAGLKSAGEIE